MISWKKGKGGKSPLVAYTIPRQDLGDAPSPRPSTNSSETPRSVMKMRARSCIVYSSWPPEMAADSEHKEEQLSPSSPLSSVFCFASLQEGLQLSSPRTALPPCNSVCSGRL